MGWCGQDPRACSWAVARPILVTLAAMTSLLSTAASSAAGEEQLSEPVRMARATWDTGWFQAEIYRVLIEALGYEVSSVTTMENAEFYLAAAAGDVDLWANGWFPLHDATVEQLGIADDLDIVGTQVGDGAFQGYLVDHGSADAGVTALADFADPEVAARFDIDGDRKADLIGCEVGWACGEVIEHHLDVLGLRDTVTHVQGDYPPLIDAVIERYEQGEPVLFYTWTPNWTVGELVPGGDVAWIQVDETTDADSPAGAGDYAVPGVPGCVADPCRPGWPPNDIRAVAGGEFLDANPAIERLLEQVAIPLDDIAAQNARMRAGEGAPEDIVRHAVEWVIDHEDQVTAWLEAADPDAVVDVGALGSGATGGRSGALSSAEPLTVVTRGLAPFVTYEAGAYSGFSVELWGLIADRLGVDYEIVQVNSLAKQIDDVQRGTADVAIGGLDITSARVSDLALSQPTLESGLQIMVRSEESGIGATLARIASSRLVTWIVWFTVIFGLILLAVGHVIWLLERDRNPDIPESYLRGIPESIWWAVVAITPFGAGNNTPRRNMGRVFAVGWILTGYFLLAYFTASITSTMAVDEIRGDIDGPEDLAGQRVATVAETPSAEFLAVRGVGPVLYDTANDMYLALDDGDVDAIVFDAPVLQHHAARTGGVHVVGPVFQRISYGFGADHDGGLRDDIDVALLELVEAGVYDTVYQRWFGGLSD